MAFRSKKTKRELTPQEKALRTKEFVHAYARYSGIAFQMLVLIGGGGLLGYWLDGKYGTFQIWSVICSVAGVALSLFTLYKSLREMERFSRRMEAERRALEENRKREDLR